MSIFSTFKWAFSMWIKYKALDPGLRFSKWLTWIGIGGVSFSGLSLSFDLKIPILSSIVAQWGEQTPLWFSIGLTAIGIASFFIRLGQFGQKWSTALVYVRGLAGMTNQAPVKDLPGKYSLGKVVPFVYRWETDAEPQLKLDEIKRISHDLDHRIESENEAPKHILFAGLTDIPILYAAGALLNTRQSVEPLNFDRNKHRWRMFDGEDTGERLTIIDPEEFTDDLAVAIPLSVPIFDEQIPESLRNSLAKVKPDWEPRIDAILSEDQLAALTETINVYIRSVSGRIKRLHLFIGGGEATVFKLGTLFQSNLYAETIVYQYDRATNGYTWAVTLNKHGIQIS